MRIRFLQTTPSLNPDVPFRAGQVIDVPKLTAEMRAWFIAPAAGRLAMAELIDETSLEAAMIGPPEQAVQARAKGRTA